MKKIKTTVTIILIAMLCIVATIMTGCGEKYHDKELGDFVVRFYDDYCAIKGTTAQGNSKKVLVIPEEIEGYPVNYLGIERYSIIMSLPIGRPEIESDTLEKVFFAGDTFAYPASFSTCKNLKKKLFIYGEVYALSNSSGRRAYLPYIMYKNSDYNQELQNWFHTVPANVSYYYNHENAANEGYYWIDDYEYGAKIEFIPQDPTRKGYTFGGWYKEADCINKWDFDTDKLPEKQIIEGVQNDSYYYQETILYAKWI